MSSFVRFYLLTLVAGIAISACVLAWKYNRLPFFEAPERFFYDLRYHFLAKREPAARPEFAIVTLTEPSLRGYPAVKPVDRELLARLVTELQTSGAQAIGLAFQFDRPTVPEKDDALARAIAASSLRMAVGVIDARSRVPHENLDHQAAFLKKAGDPLTGHIYFDSARSRAGQQPDLAVRFMAPRIPKPGETHISLAEALLEAGGIEIEEFWLRDDINDDQGGRHIAWLQPTASNGARTFTVLEVQPHDARGESGAPLLSPQQRAILTGRFVIVGADVEPNDRHLTPFSVIGAERMTNPEIHAQIAAQLKDKRSVAELSFEEEGGLAFVVATLAFLAGYTRGFRNQPSWRISGNFDYLIVATPIAILASLAFAIAGLVLPSDTLLYGVFIGVGAGHLAHNWFMPDPKDETAT